MGKERYMKSLSAFLVTVFSMGTFATEIVSHSVDTEVKTYSQNVVLKTKCQVMPGSHDRETGEYHGPYCSCVAAHVEMERLLEKSFPTMTKNTLPSMAALYQPLNTCGQDRAVEVRVTFTQPSF